MSGWDDVEVRASDVLCNVEVGGGYEPTHPVQLLMAADEVVEASWAVGDVVRCKHKPVHLGPLRHTQPTVIEDHARVTMNLYQINNVPHRDQTDFDFEGRLPLRRVYWAMGLCACGRLYWKHVGVEHYEVMR